MKGKRPLVYALGGIRRNKISTLVETGFDGFALLGSIWGKPDPVVAYREFNTSLQNISRLQLR
jgi:thiamine monophosphate synthase